MLLFVMVLGLFPVLFWKFLSCLCYFPHICWLVSPVSLPSWSVCLHCLPVCLSTLCVEHYSLSLVFILCAFLNLCSCFFGLLACLDCSSGFDSFLPLPHVNPFCPLEFWLLKHWTALNSAFIISTTCIYFFVPYCPFYYFIIFQFNIF